MLGAEIGQLLQPGDDRIDAERDSLVWGTLFGSEISLPPNVTETSSLDVNDPSCCWNCCTCPAKVSRGVLLAFGSNGLGTPSVAAVALS